MVTPEVVPFVKVGGLADVVGALSKVLSVSGHDVRLVVPKYAGMQQIENAKPLPEPLVIQLGGHEAYARVWECKLPGSKVSACLGCVIRYARDGRCGSIGFRNRDTIKWNWRRDLRPLV